MAIFYSGSARSSLSNTVITSLVRAEGREGKSEEGREEGRGGGWRGEARGGRGQTVFFVTALNESLGLIEW